ncbi:MAG: LysM peptidoglycan-binding domain-containing protein, partial [Actinobacteria bacterium]|nr:LysM peptidoglycan-binding domain-containing protein [Actinomycetota bacterium]
MVEAGDSLGKIAERFDSTVDAFMRANALSDPNKLRVGQMLLIPREREDEVEGQVGPAITMEEVTCVISAGVDAYGPTGEPTGTTGKIEIA